MSDDLLRSVGPLEAEQHGVGHVRPAGGQVLEQRLQLLSVPAGVQGSVCGQNLGSLSLHAFFLGLYWDVLGAQLAFLHHLLGGSLLLRGLRLAALGVDVEDGGSPNGASAEHAEICGPPVGGRLSLRRRDEGLVALQFDYMQLVRKFCVRVQLNSFSYILSSLMHTKLSESQGHSSIQAHRCDICDTNRLNYYFN